MTTSRAAQPSYIVLPKSTDFATVVDFLVYHFKHIEPSIWHERAKNGKIHWQNGSIITAKTPYMPTAKVYYYREVKVETKIPFEEKILYQDNQIIMVYKPHFLPVTPSGNFVNECLVHRLRIKTGIETIAPAHRLDRDTAGIILMTVNPLTRHCYHELFSSKKITKEYQAIAKLTPNLLSQYQQNELKLPIHWTVKNAIKPSEPSFLMQVIQGEANSHSEISLIAINGEFGLFKLSPITGKTHQLRLHMNALGLPILNDRFYPSLQAKSADDFNKPLQLLAQRLSFLDPITNVKHNICYKYLSL